MQSNRTTALVECAVLIALATILSMLKLVDLPYGGSVTVASMLPIVILSHRHGLEWGLPSALVFGVIQQLLGLNTLSFVTTWQSVIAVVLLDYLVAFAVIGFSGVSRRMKNQGAALVLGSLLACFLRFLCHVISGATVWAGLSIPSKAALLYSLAYNATYMIPETIVLITSAYYLGSVVDLRQERPARIAKSENPTVSLAKWGSGILIAGTIIFDTIEVFRHLQNAETGSFEISGLENVKWIRIAVISSVCLLTVVALRIYGKKTAEPNQKDKEK